MTDFPAITQSIVFDESQRGLNKVTKQELFVTWEDEFKTRSLTNQAKTLPTEDGLPPKWFAPCHGGSGGATFMNPVAPEQDRHFIKGENGLILRAVQYPKADGTMAWGTGHMQTVDAKGDGFMQKYGYWEVRAKFPPAAKGTWLAPLWLKSNEGYKDLTARRTEIDLCEAYGADPKGHHFAGNLWKGDKPLPGDTRPTYHHGNYIGMYSDLSGKYLRSPQKVAANQRRYCDVMFDGQFHTYGVKITPQKIMYYFDDYELARINVTPPEFKKPLYMLVSNQTQREFHPVMSGQYDMEIDYVRVWQNKDWVGRP